LNAPEGILFSEPGSWGSWLAENPGVGTLLLGGKTRDELIAPRPSAEGTVASRGSAPRVHVVRLPEPAESPLTDD